MKFRLKPICHKNHTTNHRNNNSCTTKSLVDWRLWHLKLQFHNVRLPIH